MKLLPRLMGLAFLASVNCFGLHDLSAQVGNDNPTGPAGEFSGDVTTGCRYDPRTASTKRSITDLVVAGGVGAYPLSFTRTSTSRLTLCGDLGRGGSWRHSYGWSINTITTNYNAPPPQDWDVNLPDGATPHFGVELGQNGNYYYTALGVPYRLEVVTDTNTTGHIYLHLPDGGRVWFTWVATATGHISWTYTFTLQGVIDPYGLTTTVTHPPADGSTTITEPAGRMLKLFYKTGPAGDTVIDRVEEWMSSTTKGRTVSYGYSLYVNGSSNFSGLTSVSYLDTTGVTYASATYTYQIQTIPNYALPPFLSTCIDPMYSGPMWKIAYTYATLGTTNPDGSNVVPGQIQSENYFDGTNVGQAVSSLTITGTNSRTETRGDGKQRTFNYNYILTNYTDFKGNATTQSPDVDDYIAAITDRNGNTTNFAHIDFINGNVTQITYPSTPNDTPPNTPQGTVKYSWVATCGGQSDSDPNNCDSTNPFWLHSTTDQGGNTTVYFRDSHHRISQVTYPDSGSESFQYNSFNQVTSHTMTTGGIDTFTYDSRGLKQTYRDPYHASGNPTAWYQYDSLDRLAGVTDALGSGSGDSNHTTSHTYNARGQPLITTLPVDPVDNQRHTIQNIYNSNSNGTLTSITDQLGHVTSFTYDDYRRLRSVTTPGHNTPVTAYFFYDPNGAGDDYTYTDANVTHAISPGGETTTTLYDADRRKISVTAGDGTADAATTSYGYDKNGNLTSLMSPNEQAGQLFPGQSTVTAYDERNRIMSITDALANATTFEYDAAGRKASVTRANGQVITYDSYDQMNRLLQQTVKQWPDPDAVTKYTYYVSGLLHTMQDPLLFATNSSYAYTYVYDQMGRKTSLTYPPDSGNVQRSESWLYDTAGRVYTFTNRLGSVETFTFDPLNRITNVSWNDSGLTPTVTYGYDVASRVTSITNANAAISHTYFNDNLLNTETATYADNTARTVTYTYNADGNRATIQYPNGGYSLTYNYTGRNQLWKLINNGNGATVMTYLYDPDGNLKTRTPNNSTNSSYTYDALDRVTHISHALNGTTRTFDYAYDSVGNRAWTKRDGANGDVFGYDLNDQSISILLNVPNPDTTAPGNQTINYDANGNRTTFAPYNSTDTYTTNDLNQYLTRNSSNAAYDNNGNMTTGLDASTYTYDAQNRLLRATKSGTTDAFQYDGLNRQVSRTVGTGSPVYKIYDGWNLIAEYASHATSPSNAYLFGAGGLVRNLSTARYYYQDASGSTSHLADSGGHLLEWYRSDLQGTPIFYNASNTQISASAYGIRHLFTGQQWYSEIGLYDLRNRFYSPDMGRFLQSDPIGFAGDAGNLYRYVGNNPVNFADPNGEFWNFFIGAAAGAGVDLSIQLYSHGWNWGAVNWYEVGISGAAGFVTSGASAFVAANVTNLGVRVAINAAVSSGVGATSQVGINAVKGVPLSSNVATNAALSALFSPLATILSAAAPEDASGVVNATFEAGAIALDNAPQFFQLFQQQSQGTTTNPFGNVGLSLGVTGGVGVGFAGMSGGNFDFVGEGGIFSPNVTIPDDPNLFGGFVGGWDYENGGQSWGYVPPGYDGTPINVPAGGGGSPCDGTEYPCEQEK